MPKMCAIPQLVSAPLNPISIVKHFRGTTNDVITVTDKKSKYVRVTGLAKETPQRGLNPGPFSPECNG